MGRRAGARGRRALELKRILILHKSGWRCHYCQKPLMLPSVLAEDRKFWARHGLQEMTVEHLTPVALGGSHDIDNLVASCHRCNHHRGPQTPAGTRAGCENGSPPALEYQGKRYRRNGQKWELE
jgi:hypothetical protein